MGKRTVNSAEVDRLPQRAFRLIVTGGGTGGHTYPALTAVRTLRPGSRLRAVRWKSCGSARRTAWRPGRSRRGHRVRVGGHGQDPPLQQPAQDGVARERQGHGAGCRSVSCRPGRSSSGSGRTWCWPPAGTSPSGRAGRARMCRRPLVRARADRAAGPGQPDARRRGDAIAVSSESTLPLLPESVRVGRRGHRQPGPARGAHRARGQGGRRAGLRGFDRRLPTVYVTGGAQGAQQINDVVRDALPGCWSQRT